MKIEPRMRVSDLSIESGSELSSPTRSKSKVSGLPSSSRQITSWIDINPAGLSTVCNLFLLKKFSN